MLNKLAGVYGAKIDAADATIDAMTIVNRISNFVMCVGMGISQGLQPVASFNYQAKKYARVKKALLVTIGISFCCIVVMGTPMIIAPTFVVSLFQKETQVVEIARLALMCAMGGQLFMP